MTALDLYQAILRELELVVIALVLRAGLVAFGLVASLALVGGLR